MANSLMHTIMVWAGIGFVFFGLTMAAVVDVARKDFGSEKTKIIWWIVAMIPVIGWFIYLLSGFWQGKVVKES